MAKLDKILDLKKLGIGKAVDIPVKEFLSTGSLALDWAISGKLQGGGVPLGRLVEFYGDPSTGKTLLVGHLLAEAQKKGWLTFYDDAENALDKFFAERIGIDLDNLYYFNSETVEGHFRRVSNIVRRVRKVTDTPILIVLDSLAALSTSHERGEAEVIEDDSETPELKFSARDMTKAQIVRSGLRVLATRFMKEDVLYVVTNHVTARIGAMYGPKTDTPGGSGMKFHASIRVQLDRGTVYRKEGMSIGHRIRATVTKNKIAPPYVTVEFDMYFDRGIVKTSGVFDILKKIGVIEGPSGGWYTCKLLGEGKFRPNVLEDRIEEILELYFKSKKEENTNEKA